jgi:hypothetical protein
MAVVVPLIRYGRSLPVVQPDSSAGCSSETAYSRTGSAADAVSP